MTVGGNMNRAEMTIAGRLDRLTVGGIFGGSSKIHAIGPEGSFGDILVGKDLNGDMDAEVSVKSLQVNGAYNGNVRANGVKVNETPPRRGRGR